MTIQLALTIGNLIGILVAIWKIGGIVQKLAIIMYQHNFMWQDYLERKGIPYISPERVTPKA